MNEKILIGLLVGLVGVVACNGGSSPLTPIYLPAGTYIDTFSNASPKCSGITIGVAYATTGNGEVKICNGSGQILQINLANNPCMTLTKTAASKTVSLKVKNCKLTPTGMTSEFDASEFSSTTTKTCSATLTFTKESDTTTC